MLALLLGLRFYFFSQSQHVYNDREHVKFTTILQEEPEFVLGKQQFRVKTPDGARVRIVTSTASFYTYGDRLFIDGVFTKKEFQGHPYLVIYFPKIQMATKDGNLFTESALFLIKRAKTIFSGSLSPTAESLLLGMIFGGNQGMEDAFLQKLRTTGVLHVIAASGANVSFVAGALLAILGKLLRRQLALVIGIGGIIFYAFLAGFDPPVTRAAIMACFAFGASLLGRQNLALLSLWLTGYVMMMVTPSLLFDVGFQLSFFSTLGILVVKSILGLLGGFRRLGFLREDVLTTLAAQIATLPIMLTTFGSYGLLSVLVNALVLWTIPIVMVFGSIALLAGLVFFPLGKVIVLLCLPFLWFFEQMVDFFGKLGGVVAVSSFPLSLSIGYYLLLLAVVLIVQQRKKEKEEKGI